jgi:type II secretory pathway component PulC
VRTCLLASIAALLCACTPTTKTSCELPTNRVQLFAQARYQPELGAGVTPGIRVTAVGAGSFLACLGVREGDRIVGFNARPIREPADVAKFFEEFGAARSLRLAMQDARGVEREIVNQ